MQRPLTPLIAATLACLPTSAQDAGAPKPGLVEPTEGRSIAWFGTLEAGRAEAARTGRPILFLSAAPTCRQVPGVW